MAVTEYVTRPTTRNTLERVQLQYSCLASLLHRLDQCDEGSQQRSDLQRPFGGFNSDLLRRALPSQLPITEERGKLAALMANFDQLRQEEKNKLIACTGELEALDLRKVENK